MRKPGRKFIEAGLACVLAVLMLGMSPAALSGASSEANPQQFNRVGHRMMCTCSCGQILLECNHVNCPESGRMINELHQQADQAAAHAGSDRTIEDWFVNKYGAVVLAAPIRGGFDNVAWIVPITTFILATLGTAWLVFAWVGRRRSLAPAGPALPPLPGADDMRARIRRETEY